MENLLNEIITVLIGLSLLAGAWFIHFLTGVSKYLFNDQDWSWTKFWRSLIETILMCIAIIAVVPVCEGINWFALQCNCDISALLEGVSIAGVLGGIIAGTLYYLKKAYANIIAFLNPDNTEVTTGEIDYKGISDAFKEALARIMNNDTPTDEETQETCDIEATGQGFSTTLDAIIGRRLADGNNDGGNGWQCSRYTAYLATGRWSYSSAHPDYGPCNGNKVAEWLVKNYGFKYIDTPVKGAIGSGGFNTTYGHTVMYLESAGGNYAIINDANCVPLTVSTYKMNISGWKWVVPGNYEPATPSTPETKTTDTDFKVGDVVVPTKLVDYNGTPLAQYDNSYTISEINGDRAVLTAPRNGQPVVWAAMNTANIRKA